MARNAKCALSASIVQVHLPTRNSMPKCKHLQIIIILSAACLLFNSDYSDGSLPFTNSVQVHAGDFSEIRRRAIKSTSQRRSKWRALDNPFSAWRTWPVMMIRPATCISTPLIRMCECVWMPHHVSAFQVVSSSSLLSSVVVWRVASLRQQFECYVINCENKNNN